MNTEKITSLLTTFESTLAELRTEIEGIHFDQRQAIECDVPTIIYDGSYKIDVDGRQIRLNGQEAIAYLRSIGVRNAQRHVTAAKVTAQLEQREQPKQDQQCQLEAFIKEQTHFVPGEIVPFGEFYDKFVAYLPDDDRRIWTKHKVSRSLPINHPSGASPRFQHKKFIANLSWEKKDPDQDAKMLIVKEGKLR